MSILNPQTFLELTQRLAHECQLPVDGVTGVTGAEGQEFDLFAWVSQAALEIDELHEDWAYLLVHPGVSFATIAGQQLYTPSGAGITAGDVSSWRKNTFRNYNTSTGYSSELHMTYVEYDTWLDTEKFGTLRTTQVRPMVFTITPEKSIGLQCPLAGYTVIADYYREPVVLEADADQPLIPPRYRMAIVYKAMMEYGAEEQDAMLFNRAERLFNQMITRMERTQLPTVSGSGALA